jgi:hypothetical protein
MADAVPTAFARQAEVRFFRLPTGKWAYEVVVDGSLLGDEELSDRRRDWVDWANEQALVEAVR